MTDFKKPTPQERKEATAKLREKHQPTFDALGISDAEFIPKMAHFQKGLTGLHMGFFESELSKGCDVYTEKVSISLEPEDPNRTLYRWRFNPHFREEYASSEATESGYVRYFLPVEELEEVYLKPADLKITAGKGKPAPEIKLPFDPNGDLPMDQMTIRDYAAIHLKAPVSQKAWLNELIKESSKTSRK